MMSVLPASPARRCRRAAPALVLPWRRVRCAAPRSLPTTRQRRHLQRARLSAAHRAARRGRAVGQPAATPGDRPNAAAVAPTAPTATAAQQRQRRHRRRATARDRDAADAFPRRSEPAPPPKPNEFQRFVEGATGRLLPIFGAAFFADAADTFQSLDNVPVSADYTIGPGDEIVTRAWGSIDVDYRSTVDRNGMLNLPKVGSFNVAGVKAADLEKNLRAQIGAALHQLRPVASRSASCAACACSSSARRSGPAW